MRSLRVLQLGPYPPPEGGVSRNILAIRDELLARGHSCSIIATTRSNKIQDEKNVYHPRSAFAFLRLLSSVEFDILHLHLGGEISPRVLALALTCSFFGRGKSVLTMHSGGFPLTDQALTASAASTRGFTLRRFSKLIAVNDAIADVIRRYGVQPDRIKVILPYSFTCPDKQITVPSEISSFFERHSPVLVSVGGLESDYDPLFQVKAMRRVLDEFPNAGLMFVGDGTMRDHVENAVAKSGYGENLFLAGNVEHAVTLHLIHDANVLLRTTLFDGDAISVREALSLGTPVIATDTGARPDGVELIRIGDENAFTEKIREIVARGNRDRNGCRPDNANIAEVVDLYEDLN